MLIKNKIYFAAFSNNKISLNTAIISFLLAENGQGPSGEGFLGANRPSPRTGIGSKLRGNGMTLYPNIIYSRLKDTVETIDEKLKRFSKVFLSNNTYSDNTLLFNS